MYSINGHKHLITLKAITLTDKLNDKNKKHNDIFEKDTSIYWVLDKKQYDGSIFWRCAVRFFETLKKEINIDINSFLKLSDVKFHQGIVTSLISASELFNEKAIFKTTKTNENINNFIISGHNDLLELSKNIVECESWTNKIITTPSNLLNSDDFENIIKNRFKEFGSKLKINVLNKTELQKRQMGLLLAVGQGSHHTNDPRLIVLEYKNANTEKIALVGKGIMFDTGGINLKPTNALKNMHADMSGAAICLGILYALIKANAKINLSVVVPLTSNEINDRSYHINDILTSYDGKTIEITNTDAEGRLILADAITYAIKDEQASTVISVATLTGAIVVALGDVFTGYWSTCDKLACDVEKSAKEACESVWRMPFHYEFTKKLNSRVADYVNCDPSRNGSSIVATEFLKIFTKDKNFLHFDIAGSNELESTFVPAMLRTLFYLLNK